MLKPAGPLPRQPHWDLPKAGFLLSLPGRLRTKLTLRNLPHSLDISKHLSLGSPPCFGGDLGNGLEHVHTEPSCWLRAPAPALPFVPGTQGDLHK